MRACLDKLGIQTCEMGAELLGAPAQHKRENHVTMQSGCFLKLMCPVGALLCVCRRH